MERLDFASVMAVLRRIKERLLPLMPDSAMAAQDQFLDVMLKYRCRILFTTRSRYENHISLEVGELNPDTLLELAARLLANGLLKPKELLTKLQKEKAAQAGLRKIMSRVGKIKKKPIGEFQTNNASFGTFPSENRPFFPAQEPRKIYEKQEDFYENRAYQEAKDNRHIFQR